MPSAENLTLVSPTVALESAFRAMLDEFQAAGEPPPLGSAADLARENFPAYARLLEGRARGEGLPPGYVPESAYWLVRDGAAVLGTCGLRHVLTPALEDVGGHIGYAISPSERRKGYGTRILALALERARVERARALGLGRVLLTCDTDNVGSARIIQKNGGVLISEGYSGITKTRVSRYWIAL